MSQKKFSTRVVIIAIIVVYLSLNNAFTQNEITQTVRGKIIDIEANTPLPGASIIVAGSNPVIGTTADNDGNFFLINVPVGRHNFIVSFIGYETLTISEILVSSGKEVVLNIGLKETIMSLSEVVIKSNTNKDKPINSMALVSSRTISVEEANRYAGGMDDPARLVTGFAGVTTSYTSSNAIIIRGNSPKGVLWRFEGVDIPAAFHFPNADVIGGGGVTVLSSQLLANSDFYTGAFPSEFGNATAGVFDIKMRTGNSENREYTAQISLLGTDFAAEGPFIKGKKSTYLFNYRYSTLGLISPLLPMSGVPAYQDLCFKLDFPLGSIGTFSFWGLGAYDVNKRSEEPDSSKWENDQSLVRLTYKNSFGTIGLSHKINFGAKTYLHSSITASAMFSELDRLKIDNHLTLKPSDYIESLEGRYSFKSVVNHKHNANISTRAGVIINSLFYDQLLKTSIPNRPETFATYVDGDGQDAMIQGFAQTKIQFAPTLYTVVGIHSMYLGITNKTSIEPRISLGWNISTSSEITAGYGLHSQIEEYRTYMIKTSNNNQPEYPNKNLDFAKQQHFVLGYNQRISEVLRFKAEVYYQYLYNIPVIADSSFSLINVVNYWAINQKLVNNGTGKNYGIDLTLERFMKNNFYYLLTASVFDSRYKGGDGIERDTRYNRNFVVNLLLGKEFKVGGENKNNLLGLSVKFTYMGGLRYTGFKADDSISANYLVWDNEQVFTNQFPNSAIVDFTVTYRKNKEKYSSVWFLMIKNATMTPDYMDPMYDWHKNQVIMDEMAVILPSIGYKIEF